MPPPRCALLLALSAACGTGPPAEPPALPVPEVAVRHGLPPGTIVRLLPVRIVTRPETAGLDSTFLDALLREALRQSVRFDVASGIDDVRSDEGDPVEVAVQADPAARVLTTTLILPEGRTVPLAQAQYGDADLPAALDRLAWETRAALGEAPSNDAVPVPCAAAYSPDPACVRRTEDANRQMMSGRFSAAVDLLGEARRIDGGSPFVLDALAAALSVMGRTEEAQRIAEEALGFQSRLAPTSEHRLARTVLLSRASLRPALAALHDRELLELADVTLRERPHDPQPLLSRALALNFLARFEESRPLLERLASRLPGHAAVDYHLGYAELALGRPAAALDAFDRVVRRLPSGATVLPRAIALFEAGEHEELTQLLESLARDPAVRAGETMHEVLRMRAAHAILQGKREEAGRFILQSIEWLRQRPSILDQRALELSEAGEVLVRLGFQDDLAVHLSAILDLRPEASVRDSVAFLSGMIEVARTGTRARATEAALAQSGGIQAWSSVLRAAGHARRGELLDELSALAQAARTSDSPLVKAATVRALRAAGRQDEADALRDAMRSEMLEVHLRRRSRHPLLDPARALAFTVD